MNSSVKIMKDNLNNLRSANGSIPLPISYQNGTATRTRLLRSRASTPNSVSDSPRSLESRSNNRAGSRPSISSSPARPTRIGHLSTSTSVSNGGGYDSDDSIRLDRANHAAMKQDIMSVKTMLLKLRRVLNETDEDILLRSETHSPFDCQSSIRGLTNGIFNGLTSCPCPSDDFSDAGSSEDNEVRARMELADLRRQVLFLQGQLEDREKTVQQLREQMLKLAADNYHANSAPASTVSSQMQDDVQEMCNAATQTERIRPISAGPSLLNGTSPVDGSAGSLVSASNDSLASTAHHRSRPLFKTDSAVASKRNPLSLWRRHGEPISPQRHFSASSIPRRADSRTRTATASTT